MRFDARAHSSPTRTKGPKAPAPLANQSVMPTVTHHLITLAQVPVPRDLPDEAACQALINPVTVMGLFEQIKAPQGRC